MSQPLYWRDRLNDERRQQNAHFDALRTADLVESARRTALARLSRLSDENHYRRAVNAVEREFSDTGGASCGELCRCVATGACEVIPPEDAANGCTRPAYARDSSTPFVVWGFNGAAFPGKPSKTCQCGKH